MDIKQGLIDIFEAKDITKVNGEKYIINPLTDHQPCTTPEMLETVVQGFLRVCNLKDIDKIIGEEDRGGFLTAIVADRVKIPFGLVKWNPDGYDGDIYVDFRNMYTEGKMYLNGVQKGDKITIVEDMIDSGGTIVAMIKLLKKHGVEIIDIFAVSVKEGLHGLEKIKEETGYDIKWLCKFGIEGDKSKITEFNKEIL